MPPNPKPLVTTDIFTPHDVLLDPHTETVSQASPMTACLP